MRVSRILPAALAVAFACCFLGKPLPADPPDEDNEPRPPAASPARPTPDEDWSHGKVRVVPEMDAEGIRLSNRLSHLHGGPEFERVYLEHARHIRMAQEAARRRDLGEDMLTGSR